MSYNRRIEEGMKMKCEACAKKMEIDYFEVINELIHQYGKKLDVEANHLIIGIKEMFELESSNSLLKRLKYIKTSQGLLGTYILGLKVIVSKDIKGMHVAYLC